MKNTEHYWLAGLLEGEGSFLKPAPSNPNRVVISIEMTDEDVVKRAAAILGCSYYKVSSRKKTWKSTFTIRCRGKTAVEWMEKLRPLMGDRRKAQIDEALAHYDPDRRQRYLNQCRNHSKLSPKVIEEARENMENGSGLRAEARRIGVHHESLRRALKRT